LSVDALLAVLGGGDASAYMNAVGPRLPAGLHPDVGALLGSPATGRRLLGAVRTVIELCHGADARLGLELATGLMAVLERDLARFAGAGIAEDVLRWCCASAVNSRAQAMFLEGAWAELEAVLRDAARAFPFVVEHDLYWNARALAARALVRQNRVIEAGRWIAELRGPRAGAPAIELAEHELAAFERRRFEVDRKPPLAERAGTIWSRSFRDIIDTLQAMRDQLGASNGAGDALAARRLIELGEIQRETEELLQLSQAPGPFDARYAEVTRKTERWHDRLHRFVHPNSHDRPDFETLGRCLHHAATVHAIAAPDPAIAEPVLREIERVAPWAARAGDLHGLWMLAWSRGLILEKLGRATEALAGIGELCAHLDDQRSRHADDETRSNIANFFPGIASMACRLAASTSNLDALITACELRKSRSLLATRADARVAQRLVDRPVGALGARTHYLSYVASEHDDRIYALLYSADGAVTMQPIDADVRTVRAQWPRLDPSRWSLVRFQPRDVQRVLADLVRPIADALRSGRLAEGDHVCVAADDPVHLIPLHYLPIGDRLVVQLVSMSRVASFSDACAIVAAPARRPAHGHAVFVESEVARLDAALREFGSVAAMLRGHDAKGSDRRGRLTAAEVLRELGPDRVLHVDAHGAFRRDADAYRDSGLVVADERGDTRRDGARARLLSPAVMLEARHDLTGSHVTLCACVSGTGLEGMGGDVLGMELALRLCGAASVLASHWNVVSEPAAELCRRYYERWLRDGMTRAAAWQTSITSLMQREGTAAAAAQWCAFSLFGDWR
jgi:CHAT domain-containing protein